MIITDIENIVLKKFIKWENNWSLVLEKEKNSNIEI